MTQPGLFDLSDRETLPERLGDLLPKIDQAVGWEGFRSELEKIREKPRKTQLRAQTLRCGIDGLMASSDMSPWP